MAYSLIFINRLVRVMTQVLATPVSDWKMAWQPKVNKSQKHCQAWQRHATGLTYIISITAIKPGIRVCKSNDTRRAQ